jgi:hypothetical protein
MVKRLHLNKFFTLYVYITHKVTKSAVCAFYWRFMVIASIFLFYPREILQRRSMLFVLGTSHKVKGGWAGLGKVGGWVSGSLFLSTVEGVGHKLMQSQGWAL